MASINYAAREISVKIVYYGPGLSGKTTNLQIIHKKVPQDYKSDMVSLATETDRTLFFDFLPLDLGKIKGFSAKFQLYTVPGQVYYNATRKLVLRGVDGVVFVADSAQDKLQENIESFQNLMDNLAEYGYKREQVPLIIQYNKRDLPNAMPIEQMQPIINKYNVPWSEASAIKGKGVFESLKLIGKIVIDELNRKYSRGSRSSAAAQPKMTQTQGMQQRPQPQQPTNRPQMPQQRPVAGRPPVPPQPPRRPNTQAAPQRQWRAPDQKPATPPPPHAGQAKKPFSPPPPPRNPQQFAPPPPPPQQQRQQFAQQPPGDQHNQPRGRQPMPPQEDPFIPNTPVQGQNYQEDYDSVNLEPLDSGFNARPFPSDNTKRSQKSELDLEIERYQQEIYDHNTDMGSAPYGNEAQSQYETFEPQDRSYSPNDYQNFDHQGYGQGYDTQNYSFDAGNYDAYGNDQNSAQDTDSDYGDGEATFEIEPQPYPNNGEFPSAQNQGQDYNYYQDQDQNPDNYSYGYDQTQYDQPQYNEPPEKDDKPMYFTSVDMDNPPKKGKKPVNPKNKQKKGLFGRFRKNIDDDDDLF